MKPKRTYLRSRLALPLLAGALLAPAPAAASVTIGQLPPTAPAATCASGSDYLQPSVTGGYLYVAKQGGTITSWSTTSPGSGAAYAFKVFRRTSDPDVFQVVGRAPARALSAGVNTFPVDVHVEPGDMIGFHETGAGRTPCTFPTPGDAVLTASADVGDGQAAEFSPVSGARLNLSAVLVPSNSFTITGISRHRRNGTATLTAAVSNPGVVTIGGQGLRAKRVTIAVARSVSFKLVTTGKRKRSLYRRGRVRVPLTVTFFPAGGDPSSQTISVKLRLNRA